MTALAYIVAPKYSDLATLASSGTIANSGVDLVKNAQPRIRAIFTSGSCWIEGDFGVSRTIDTFGLGFITSLSSADTVRVRVKDSYPVTSSPLEDLTVTIWPSGSDLSAYKDKHRQVVLTQARTARYFRVDLSCSVAPELGRLIVGRKVEPLNTITAWGLDANEPVASTVDFSNQETRRSTGGSRRSVHLEWPPAMSESEALGRLYETILERGSAKDYMVVLDSETGITLPMAYIYVGCGVLKISFNTLTHFFGAALDLTELAPLRML